MKKNSYPGRFIVFEGLDGSGQSTQAALLKNYFVKQGKKVLLTKEPTRWTKAAKAIKRVLEGKEKKTPLALQKLFIKDRAEHLQKEIVPALKAGKIVISDRYFLSTLAYGALNLPLKKLIILNEKFIEPDIIFLLKVSPEECVRRIKLRGEKIKFFEKLNKLKKIWKNYQKIIKIFPSIVVINGEGSIKEIHNMVRYFYGLRTNNRFRNSH